MTTEIKQILEELKAIRNDLDYIKESIDEKTFEKPKKAIPELEN